MFEIIRANERGRAHFGWLKSQHTFSFGDYYNPQQMGFSALRVINDDEVAPGAGFSTHGHRNMEIISYVLQGQIAHKDSAGNEEILPAGEFQLMSAGKGIYHSEYNASKTAPLKFLQIWIEPNQFDGAPGYQQKDFGRQPGLTWVITPDGRDGTLTIKQDAALAQLLLAENDSVDFPLQAGRAYYLHLIQGELTLAGLTLQPGDGLKIAAMDQLQGLAAKGPVLALWFDLPG
ncbi:pirin family protein [Alishewanella sp. BS5-314]|uniref:pirin family protein n=1 Tax=Alishewanella sp. BS5-314 TaxID=2755587 RepID=UPI0021BA7B7D|nr:pirin family protein [Alishewanella sp. BS5-314]MCT8124660.1 pirin family protein [Alishewanella sp. BS5-314]